MSGRRVGGRLMWTLQPCACHLTVRERGEGGSTADNTISARGVTISNVSWISIKIRGGIEDLARVPVSHPAGVDVPQHVGHGEWIHILDLAFIFNEASQFCLRR